MTDKAHSVHVKDEVAAPETVAPVAPRGRGRQRCLQAAANPQPTAQRLDRLEDTVLNLSNIMTQFVATMTSTQVAPTPALIRPLDADDNLVGCEDQASLQAAHGERAARRQRNL